MVPPLRIPLLNISIKNENVCSEVNKIRKIMYLENQVPSSVLNLTLTAYAISELTVKTRNREHLYSIHSKELDVRFVMYIISSL